MPWILLNSRKPLHYDGLRTQQSVAAIPHIIKNVENVPSNASESISSFLSFPKSLAPTGSRRALIRLINSCSILR